MSVLVFHNSPSTVFVIKRDPVVFNVFINFDVSNLQAGEAVVKFLCNPGAKKLVNEQKCENEKKRPGGRISELKSKHSINCVMCGVR